MDGIKVLRREWLTYRKTLIWAGIYLLVFSLAFRGLLYTQGGYVFALVLAAYMAVAGTIQGDERNRSDYMLRLLPVRPWAVVLGKFLLGGSVWLFGCLAYTLLGLLNRLWPAVQLYPLPTFATVGLAFLGISLLELLMVPLLYRFGSERGRILLPVVAFLFFGGIGALFTIVMNLETGMGEALQQALWQRQFLWGCAALGAGLVLQGIGFRIALGIYRRRDL